MKPFYMFPESAKELLEHLSRATTDPFDLDCPTLVTTHQYPSLTEIRSLDKLSLHRNVIQSPEE